MSDMTPRLFPPDFVRPTLELRVAAARRFLRPLSLVLFDVGGALSLEIASAASAALRSGDVLGFWDEAGPYALVLDDTSESGAVEAVTRLRDRIGGAPNGRPVVAGIACYPTQGTDAVDLIDCAEEALASARRRADGTTDLIEVGQST